MRVSTRPNERIGVVGFNCNTGLGELNRQIATYAEVDRWLIKPHPQIATNDDLFVDSTICTGGVKVQEFIRSIDTLLFCEHPYYDNLITYAKQYKKRLVCVPMMEWMTPGAKGWPQEVDLFICPTGQCFDLFSKTVNCIHFPWPVDVNRFKYIQRDTCNKFLFINGHGGFQGRKGASVIKEALELWPEMPLLVRSQKKEDWPKSTEFLPEEKSNADIYSTGDVLISPHSVDGLGLEPMEAMACGMPVITTDGLPWNEIPSIGKIKAHIEKRRVRRPVDWHVPSAAHLVSICKNLLGTSLTKYSKEARTWAESNSWNPETVARFNKIVRGEETVGS